MQSASPQINGLRVALEMEQRGRNLYVRAQQFTKDPKLLELLQTLAADEEKHHAQFAAMLEVFGVPMPHTEDSALTAAKAADFFFPGGLMQVAMDGALESPASMLEEAMQAERDSIAFYGRLLAQIDDVEMQEIILRILREEMNHLRTLRDRRELYQDRGESSMRIERRHFGKLEDETDIFLYTLRNEKGSYAEISTLGGCLVSLVVPDKNGDFGDVLLGYSTLDTMRAGKGYMGMLIGRYGNRIGGASFELNGKTYPLAKNDGENHLHGGLFGFDKKVWSADTQGDRLVLTLHSPDGDEGYPGALDVTVTYQLTNDNALRIQYEATCDRDTVLNLTNHAYFNLSGPQCASITGHWIQINADAIAEVASRACIPTGRLAPVDGTPFDLRTPRSIGEGLSHQAEDTQMQYGNGYDHNFVIKGWDKTLRQACIVEDPASGRRMETWTDQPGVQFYTGNSISGPTPGKKSVPYVSRQGFCLETQHYPDSVHHPDFPTCVLRKGEKYETVTEYRFTAR